MCSCFSLLPDLMIQLASEEGNLLQERTVALTIHVWTSILNMNLTLHLQKICTISFRVLSLYLFQSVSPFYFILF